MRWRPAHADAAHRGCAAGSTGAAHGAAQARRSGCARFRGTGCNPGSTSTATPPCSTSWMRSSDPARRQCPDLRLSGGRRGARPYRLGSSAPSPATSRSRSPMRSSTASSGSSRMRRTSARRARSTMRWGSSRICSRSRPPSGSAPAYATGASLRACAGRSALPAIWCRMPSWPRWRSSMAVNS